MASNETQDKNEPLRQGPAQDKLNFMLTQIELMDMSVYQLHATASNYSEADRELNQVALLDIMTEHITELTEEVEELNPSLQEDEAAIPSSEIRKLYATAHQIYNFAESYYLLANTSEQSLAQTYYEAAMNLISLVTKKIRPELNVYEDGIWGSLNQDTKRITSAVQELSQPFPVGGILFRGLLTLLCILGIGAAFYLPAVKNFLDGRWLTWVAANFLDGGVVMWLLAIGAAILFFRTWKEEDFWTACGMQFVVALIVSIPVGILAVLAFFLGAAMTERIVVAAVLAFCVYACFHKIPSDLRYNKHIKQKQGEIAVKLRRVLPYAKDCLDHGKQIGADERIINHYKAILDRLEKAQADFIQKI